MLSFYIINQLHSVIKHLGSAKALKKCKKHLPTACASLHTYFVLTLQYFLCASLPNRAWKKLFYLLNILSKLPVVLIDKLHPIDNGQVFFFLSLTRSSWFDISSVVEEIENHDRKQREQDWVDGSEIRVLHVFVVAIIETV